MELIINKIEDAKKYYIKETNTYNFVDDSDNRIDLKITENIDFGEANIDAHDIDAHDIDAHDIDAHDIDAGIVKARNIIANHKNIK